jgi:hypothetical protein
LTQNLLKESVEMPDDRPYHSARPTQSKENYFSLTKSVSKVVVEDMKSEEDPLESVLMSARQDSKAKLAGELNSLSKNILKFGRHSLI